MGERPMISVIIPYYNVAEFLFTKCIDSVLAQTFNDFEVLIIDDGSKVEFQKALNAAESRDSRIRIVHRSNGGVSAARNIGVELAKGEYIAFIDADDIVHPRFMEESYGIVKETGADMVAGAIRDFNAKTEGYDSLIESTNSFSYNHRRYKGNEIDSLRPILISSNRLMRFPSGGYLCRGPVARLIKAEIVKSVSFPEGIAIGEDVIWNQCILALCKDIVIAENIWYFYFYIHNEASAIHRYRENAIETIRFAGIRLLSSINISEDDIYRAFCSRLFSQTRLIVCQAYLTNNMNKEGFFKKYGKFNRLKKEEPWSLITRRLWKVGSKDEKFYFLLFKTNLYYPLAYLRDRLSQ